MKHTILGAGHVNNVKDLDFILKDTPTCQGRKELRLCTFSNIECKKQCYESVSYSCSTYKFLEQIKSHYDKFGVNLR